MDLKNYDRTQGGKGLQHALLCELCKGKIYGVYSVMAGMKICYKCDKGVDDNGNNEKDRNLALRR